MADYNSYSTKELKTAINSVLGFKGKDDTRETKTINNLKRFFTRKNKVFDLSVIPIMEKIDKLLEGLDDKKLSPIWVDVNQGKMDDLFNLVKSLENSYKGKSTNKKNALDKFIEYVDGLKDAYDRSPQRSVANGLKERCGQNDNSSSELADFLKTAIVGLEECQSSLLGDIRTCMSNAKGHLGQINNTDDNNSSLLDNNEVCSIFNAIDGCEDNDIETNIDSWIEDLKEVNKQLKGDAKKYLNNARKDLEAGKKKVTIMVKSRSAISEVLKSMNDCKDITVMQEKCPSWIKVLKKVKLEGEAKTKLNNVINHIEKKGKNLYK